MIAPWVRAGTGSVLALLLIGGALPDAASAAPDARREPISMTAPAEVPAYSTFVVAVVVPPAEGLPRRKAVLTGSRGGTTFAPVASWPVAGLGRHSLVVSSGTTPGRLWLRTVVTGKGLRPQTRTISIRVTNPYRPSVPGDVEIPEQGITVPGTLFGNHPVAGVPEFAAAVRLWDTSTSWNQIEKARGQYSWDALDRAVAVAERAGQEVLLVLGGTPAWAAVAAAPGSEFAGVGSSMPMTDAVLFEEYVRAVVTRYGPRIQAYQIWNEANIASFWRGTPQLMADLTARAYRVIKEAQPGATVVAASTGSRWVKGFTEFYPAYLASLADVGWPIDAYSVHLYPLATGTPRDRSYLLGLMRTALRIAAAPAKPIWETEINYGVTNPGLGETARAIPAEDIPEYVSRTYLDSLRYGIARTYWYAWTPEYRLLGIQMWNGYPASVAYHQVRDWVVGATFTGCTTSGVVVQCSFDRGGGPFYVAYTDDASTTQVPAPAGVSVVTTLEGATSPAGAAVTVGGTPVRIS